MVGGSEEGSKEIDRKDPLRIIWVFVARNYGTLIYCNPLHSPLIKHERLLPEYFTTPCSLYRCRYGSMIFQRIYSARYLMYERECSAICLFTAGAAIGTSEQEHPSRCPDVGYEGRYVVSHAVNKVCWVVVCELIEGYAYRRRGTKFMVTCNRKIHLITHYV